MDLDFRFSLYIRRKFYYTCRLTKHVAHIAGINISQHTEPSELRGILSIG